MLMAVLGLLLLVPSTWVLLRPVEPAPVPVPVRREPARRRR
jgi:hypothetical protein